MDNDFHGQSIQPGAAGSTAVSGWNTSKISKREVKYRFLTHYHPFTGDLIETLNRDGIPALLDPVYQAGLARPLSDWYAPGAFALTPLPNDEIDESDDGPYAVYNWELFFHAPLTLAVHLSKNQRFAEAQQWFHYIFDPTCNDKTIAAPERFWKFLRFRNETTPTFVTEMLQQLAEGKNDVFKAQIEKNIQAWRNKPFQPHAVARNRYMAYQLNVVMKYLDNLIAWGDYLFRQDTMETLNEATQVYVLASNILGPKPQKIPPKGKAAPKTYRELQKKGIDAFGNALIDIENDFPHNTSPSVSKDISQGAPAAAFGVARSLYFCIPQNDQLLAYWDVIADRLFKLRHCMNIEGVVRQLPLFDPPIDPGMLVKAAAAGLSIDDIVNGINQPVSAVRGPLLLQKALEICAEVRSLGAALLSALEKKDAEKMALLRQQHELTVLKLTQDIKFVQWKETEAATEALLRSRDTAFERYRHYKRLLGTPESDINKLKTISLSRKALTQENFDEVYAELVGQFGGDLPREDYRKETSVGGLMEFAGNAVTGIDGGELGKNLPLNKNENAELNIFLPAYDTFNFLSTSLKLASPFLAMIPQFKVHLTPIGLGGVVEFGGEQLKGLVDSGSAIAQQISAAFLMSAERASKMGGYYRRAEDYVLQANTATGELVQYGRQVIASLIREQITRKEYEAQGRQIEQSEAAEIFLKEKFTSEELYGWMQGEISKIYFSAYQFAFDLAKKSEQTMKHELMRKEFDDLNLIRFGYWDSARKGLLAGEALYLDLKRLEMAYHENNRREYELTKHISIRKLDPVALLRLKATGSCEIEIPEWLYDLDSPGQFHRRIKTMALSIPCITGPYTSIHAKLSLLQSSVRISSVLADGKYARSGTGDIRFRDYNGTIQSVVTSSAQNDSGLFEVNLRDERYLPFEGAGAVSRWKIEIPNARPQFDFETVSDVILHLRYTAREAGNLSAAATGFINSEILTASLGESFLQLFSLNSDFSNAWHLFKAAPDAAKQLAVSIDKNSFPYWVKSLATDAPLQSTFYSIDLSKNKLLIASENIDFTVNAGGGWSLTVGKANNTIFNFLQSAVSQNRNVYMVVSYKV